MILAHWDVAGTREPIISRSCSRPSFEHSGRTSQPGLTGEKLRVCDSVHLLDERYRAKLVPLQALAFK